MKIIFLFLFLGMILPVFAQEPTSNNESSQENLIIQDILNGLEKVKDGSYLILIPIIISLFSAGMVLFTYFKIQSKNQQAESMLACFKILSDFSVKHSKEYLAKEWDFFKRNNKKVIFTNNIKWKVQKVLEAYNQACALYELGLLNKKHFRKVYGGTIVRTFRLCSDHIDYWRIQSENDEFCIHFDTVAKELMDKHGFDQKPYPSPEFSENDQ